MTTVEKRGAIGKAIENIDYRVTSVKEDHYILTVGTEVTAQQILDGLMEAIEDDIAWDDQLYVNLHMRVREGKYRASRKRIY